SVRTEAGGRRFRGQCKQPLWQRPEQVSVIVLPLVVDGDRERRRLEKLFAAMHSIKRALQRDVSKRLRAYWASPRRLRQDAAEWRERLGMSREGLEHRAYRHLEGSRWLLGHLSKALVMHQADEVWAGVARHLFGDGKGRRSGIPQVGRYWEFLRIPGRARSHTSKHKWETFRLFGTLEGHLAAYRHPGLPEEITSPAQAASLPPGTHVLAQPRHPRPPRRPASWWDYSGPLLLVFNGGPSSQAGDLVLPVRLPQGAGRWPYLVHHLDRSERWHKVDLPPHEIHGFRGDPGGAAAGCLGQWRLGLRGTSDDPGRWLLLTCDQGPSRRGRRPTAGRWCGWQRVQPGGGLVPPLVLSG
ncbi:MAG TPA: hypothetical protein VFH51_17740, partial [Myxococcota bacterium]|nr:hypothetical protein [Myxococcota bacterium]